MHNMTLKEYLLFKREKAQKANYLNSVVDLDRYILELEELEDTRPNFQAAQDYIEELLDEIADLNDVIKELELTLSLEE